MVRFSSRPLATSLMFDWWHTQHCRRVGRVMTMTVICLKAILSSSQRFEIISPFYCHGSNYFESLPVPLHWLLQTKDAQWNAFSSSHTSQERQLWCRQDPLKQRNINSVVTRRKYFKINFLYNQQYQVLRSLKLDTWIKFKTSLLSDKSYIIIMDLLLGDHAYWY